MFWSKTVFFNALSGKTADPILPAVRQEKITRSRLLIGPYPAPRSGISGEPCPLDHPTRTPLTGIHQRVSRAPLTGSRPATAGQVRARLFLRREAGGGGGKPNDNIVLLAQRL